MEDKEDITIDKLEEFLSEMSATIKTVPLEDSGRYQLTQNINSAKTRIQQLRKEIADLKGKITQWEIQLNRIENRW